jgi:hydroxymethylglutaryl-CoA lyase
LFDLGCYEVSLGDTVGKGTPEKTALLMKELGKFSYEKIAVHFHDTFDNAVENILTATGFGNFCLMSGIRVVDSSIGGLGGCPYSMKPVGNVCT